MRYRAAPSRINLPIAKAWRDWYFWIAPEKNQPMRRLSFSLLFPFLLALAAAAQIPANHEKTSADAIPAVTFGNATVALTGPWKFRTGDNMAWTQASFDDAAWDTIDLTPLQQSYDPSIGSGGFVPGWTARGYKGYSGYAWYRLRINVKNPQRVALALKMPDDIDDAYQVYVNGQFVGEFGRFTSKGVTDYESQPRAFPLPRNVRDGHATIAIRMWMSTFTPLVDQDAGGLHGPPVLGKAESIDKILRLDWEAFDRSLYGGFFEAAVLLVVVAVAFGLFWLDPQEPAYLWLGLICSALLTRVGLFLAVCYVHWIDANVLFLLGDAVLIPTIIALWVLFWAHWFRLVGIGRLHRLVWSLAALLGLGTAMLRAPLYGTVVPPHASIWLSPLTLWLKLLLGVLLVWVTARGIREDKTEGLLALPVVVLVILSQYQEELLVFHIPTQFFPNGFGISLVQTATVLTLVTITILLLRRFLHAQRAHHHLQMELRQAQQVQHTLLPEPTATPAGFHVESVYRPAAEVGGDFFQILPAGGDGLLIVIGDVSGKGLRAAMLVSLIVGTLRTLAEQDPSPAELLRGMNRRLHRRMEGGFATCICARIDGCGRMTIANAGHLPPYLNGVEIPVPADLPLGIVLDLDYEEHTHALQPDARLVFLTDGIVEARNRKRELYGFDRTRILIRRSVSEIVRVAQHFGQEDDMTVVDLVWHGKPIKSETPSLVEIY